jgi:hypothetical protein
MITFRKQTIDCKSKELHRERECQKEKPFQCKTTKNKTKMVDAIHTEEHGS